MTIPFTNIPSNLRTPLFFAEFDNSQANTASTTQRTLIIGQTLPESTLPANVPLLVSSTATTAALAGAGSMLHGQIAAYLANDTAGEVYLLPLNDADSMTAAIGKITVTTPAAATGVISLYIGGIRVQTTVVATDDVNTIAAALAAAIEGKPDLPVSVVHTGEMVSEGAVVVLAAKNKGVHGNDIDLRLNYLGSAGGESTPDSLVLTLTPMAGGTGAPDLAGGLANLQDRTFGFIINPYTDTVSLDALKAFLSDSTGRWSYSQQLYGHSFAAQSGTYGQLTAAGELRNDQHASLLGIHHSPTPAHIWSAAYVGAIAQSLRNDPGRPLQTLAVNGVLAPPLSSRFTLTERNNLLHSGISTVTVADDGTVQVENIITTYQTNKYGAEDDSYLQIETLFLLMFVTRYLRTQVTSKFARMKLAADGTRFAAGSAIITPNVIRAELIAQYQTLEFNGYVQDAKGFARGLIVEKSASNPNRVDVLWTGVLINQLRIFAVLNQFRLQATA
ncbi:phage tail sheath subtilisin-like domain-containing protein [Yersinia enterocolitica]|uniref:phage tail sheath subtilisin-like domain-containing protein n=1 Tax=Yersinia enterocolitica TaxID=630 RepID=UPI0005E867F0|nr:phage tail sheath subtilisin-like domain-containing protein [Yersinia enterocolitica]EKN3386207.1 phage tail sheath subtilisin-like domain-containing protein [Yersinia enterocolitica]EKN3587515.1 phage tail sheath subtilisin-like domain-containing protein [Yersinia enterocolitica]EKN3766736.1 phage tail sheath subtilisin-like domain-containing protein [Yersinia enterocolitica]EKN4081675.1 phage tail sheath subtilisin-like domain-containing protein [Yersinia enterocolitica]EKN4720632.1 phage